MVPVEAPIEEPPVDVTGLTFWVAFVGAAAGSTTIDELTIAYFGALAPVIVAATVIRSWSVVPAGHEATGQASSCVEVM